MPTEAGRGHHSYQSKSYKLLWATMWVFRVESRVPGRAASALTNEPSRQYPREFLTFCSVIDQYNGWAVLLIGSSNGPNVAAAISKNLMKTNISQVLTE